MEYIDIALNPKRILNHLSIIKEKEKLLVNNEYKNKKLIRAGHVELQLTDRCQLNCTHCHFRGMGDYDFKIDWIDNISDYIKPEAVTIAGGGEPTLYPLFKEAIVKLGRKYSTKIGLITNGVFIPDGDWHRNISWVRISVYSIINDKYSGKPAVFLDRVLRNIKWYLTHTDIPNIGVHFLFYRENVNSCVKFAKHIYSAFKPYTFNRLHIQFKPAFMVARPTILTKKLHRKNVTLLPTKTQLNNLLSEFQFEIERDENFKNFLGKRTNYSVFQSLINDQLTYLLNITNPEIQEYNKVKLCYTCLAFQLIAPNGFIYPCLSLAEYRLKKFSLYHISDIVKNKKNHLSRYYQASSECCNDYFCRNYIHNQIVCSNLHENINHSMSDNLFF